MVEMIDFSKIEKKWQKKWAKQRIFETQDKVGKKENYYVLEQFPYPSGTGLHMGHAFIYTLGDIFARFKRSQGFNVLHPMGFDSFGLPAENAAIKAKSHPKKFTEEAIINFKKQMNLFGFSYDWDREVVAHRADFYKWDQWIFLKMFEKGLAYKKKSGVNWCSECNTVLANEQVNNGKCWRHDDTNVEVKYLEQWYLKITDYAEELLRELDKLDDWPEEIKRLQRNWIGRSEGTEVVFKNVGQVGKDWKVFTTRPDTLFGVTFLVVSAQHSELDSLVTKEQKKEVDKFLKKVNSVSNEDMAKLEKEGVFTGSYAKHPLTGKEVPIWIGNFVLADYGSGMVMAVPAHDQRDFDFAKKYGLDIKKVILSSEKVEGAYTGTGVLINSEGFNGLKNVEAKEHIINALKIKKLGNKIVKYKLRDWLISRQRFWGTPIPIIYCGKCGVVPVSEKDLPVKLPEDVKLEGTENPLKTNDKFLNVKCPKCSGNAKRETDTMDTFVNSSWYFLRYLDSKNDKKIFDSRKVESWMPIDIYIGGREHACMHDIYFRFYTKFLRDIGLIDFGEPAKRLFTQGFVYGPDGRKMSKSYGNVVVPEEAGRKYGVDSVRLFLVSNGSMDSNFVWSETGVEGSLRFILQVMEFAKGLKKEGKNSKLNNFGESILNRTIRDVEKDYGYFKYNLAVIKIRKLFDVLKEGCDKKSFEIFLKLLSPICPHITEEIWSKLENKTFLSLEKWPKFDEKRINDKLEETVNAVDKTVLDVLNILKIIRDKAGKDGEKVWIYVLPQELEFYDSKKLSVRIGKEVEVFAVNDSKKYDPEGKSKKVRPGRPGIYVE